MVVSAGKIFFESLIMHICVERRTYPVIDRGVDSRIYEGIGVERRIIIWSKDITFTLFYKTTIFNRFADVMKTYR